MNLGLTVDSGFDYTLNATYPAYGGRIYDGENKGLFDRSSIMWLTRRQGYRQAELREALFQIKENKDAIESPYLRSAAMEIWHELSDLNQLCFFISIPLRELLLMMSMQRWGKKHKKWPGYVLVGTETVCGFLDRFQGSCSLLGIRLEKPVKLPLDVLEIEPDGSYGYGIYEIRGYEPNHIPEVWKPGCVRYYGLPRGFRRDAASMGIRRLPAAEKNRQ